MGSRMPDPSPLTPAFALCGPCEDCRFWSEMLAEADAGGVRAVCLAIGGSRQGKWTRDLDSCESWADGALGAIDTPGFDGTEYEQGAP